MVKGKRNRSNSNRGYKKLILYKKAKGLVLLTYKLTSKFPKNEAFTLVPQMRRAAISILANIVEGYAKDSSKEYCRFLTISIGSLTELEVFFDLSQELGYINKESSLKAEGLLLDTKKLLYGTRKSVRSRF